MSLDEILTLIFVFLPICFALLCLYYSFQLLKAARNIEDTPTSKIRSAAQGYVELSGTIKTLEAITYAKLTKQPCAWYYYKIEELVTYRTKDETTSSWNMLEQGVSIDPFLLDDGTGECAILPFGAEIIPTTKMTWRGHSRTPTPPPTSFLSWLLWNSWGSYRYTESRLELNTPLNASGMFYTLQQTHPSIQDNLSLNAYCTEKKSPTLNILTNEGMARDQDFIISTIPQIRLIRQFKLKSLVFLIAFFFLSILSVYSSYPIVKNSLKSWQNKKIFHLSPFFFH